MTNYTMKEIQLSDVALHLLTLTSSSKINKIIGDGNHDGNYKIILTINDVDVSENFLQLCKLVDSQFDSIVEKRAKQIAAEKYDEIIQACTTAKELILGDEWSIA